VQIRSSYHTVINHRNDPITHYTMENADTADADERVCRICLENSTAMPLLSPCRCSGTHGYVHEMCLQHWVETTTLENAKTTCQLCRTPYATRAIQSHYSNPSECTPCSASCKRWSIRCLTSIWMLGFVVVGVSMFFAYWINLLVCNKSDDPPSRTIVRNSTDPTNERSLMLCNAPPLDKAVNLYNSGSLFSMFLMTTFSFYFILVHGCDRWCRTVCATTRPRVMTVYILFCFIGAYIFNDPMLQTTAIYLFMTSMLYKSIWSVHAETPVSRYLIRAQAVRFTNLNENDGTAEAAVIESFTQDGVRLEEQLLRHTDGGGGGGEGGEGEGGEESRLQVVVTEGPSTRNVLLDEEYQPSDKDTRAILHV
jgi:hypothetical protein